MTLSTHGKGHGNSRRIPLWLGLAALSLLLAACALFRPGKGLKSCRYIFRSVELAGVDLAGTQWRLDLGVINPNAHAVTLEKMSFALVHGGDTLVSGWNPAKRSISPRDSQVIQTNFAVPHGVWSKLPPDLLRDSDARFLLLGDVYLNTWVGEIHVPNAMRESLHVDMPKQMAKVQALMMRRFLQFGNPAQPVPEPPPVQAPAPLDEPL